MFFALASRLMRRVFGRSRKIALANQANVCYRPVAQDARETPAADGTSTSCLATPSRAPEYEPRLATVIELHYFGALRMTSPTASARRCDRHRDIRLARRLVANESAAPRPA